MNNSFEVWWASKYKDTLGVPIIEASFKEVAQAAWDAAVKSNTSSVNLLRLEPDLSTPAWLENKYNGF